MVWESDTPKKPFPPNGRPNKTKEDFGANGSKRKVDHAPSAISGDFHALDNVVYLRSRYQMASVLWLAHATLNSYVAGPNQNKIAQLFPNMNASRGTSERERRSPNMQVKRKATHPKTRPLGCWHGISWNCDPTAGFRSKPTQVLEKPSTVQTEQALAQKPAAKRDTKSCKAGSWPQIWDGHTGPNKNGLPSPTKLEEKSHRRVLPPPSRSTP